MEGLEAGLETAGAAANEAAEEEILEEPQVQDAEVVETTETTEE